ncbi:50S ribosomal protein L23 [Arsenophonus symbiont of Ornithomya chloropus]|uniref:50S ribosomal protein L23 n=1 Tax=Arsenophonus symbiont of Ornithomya chloropus TaxID=634121 RepID=UPI0032B21CB1
MTREELLLKILCGPHMSEKASTAIKRNNTIVLKVARDATKSKIKNAIHKIFEVEVKNVNTLLVKGKMKVHSQKKRGRKNSWKKAYVTLKEGQKIDFIGTTQ